MPSGVMRLRNSKTPQNNPRVGHEQQDVSGYRGTDTRPVAANLETGSGNAITKPGTFLKYTDVAPTKPLASDHGFGKEGKKRRTLIDRRRTRNGK